MRFNNPRQLGVRHSNTICLMVLLLVGSPSVWAEKTTPQGRAPMPLVVGVQDFPDYLPYSEYENGIYSGFNRDLLDLFAATYNYRFEYRARPIKRLERELLSGELDLKYPDNRYWNAAHKQGHTIYYSDAVVRFIDGVMVVPQNVGRNSSQLTRLGVVLGFTPYPYQEAIEAGTVTQYSSSNIRRQLRQTIMGKLDGAYINIAVGRHYLEAILNNQQALLFDTGLPHVNSTRHLSSIGHPRVIAEFNHFLQQQAPAIEALKQKHRLFEPTLSNSPAQMSPQ